MDIRYRGRTVTQTDVAFLQNLIAANPGSSRRALSLLVCKEWNWVQPNGEPRDMVCRSLLLTLHRSGLIELPSPRRKGFNPSIRRKPSLAGYDVDTSPVEGRLRDLGALEFRQLRRRGPKGSEERLFEGLIDRYHYLGYTQPVGEHLKYFVYSGSRPVACVTFQSAPRHLGPRDRFIGWSQETRRRNVSLVAYNTRYLVLPWIRVRYLASHLLSRVVRRLSSDWEELYHHPVYFAETFVNPERHKGSCYRAANWVYLGRTTGRGKNDQTNKPNRPIKDVLGYPLVRDFRERLREVGS